MSIKAQVLALNERHVFARKTRKFEISSSNTFRKKKTVRGWSYNHPSDGKGLKVNKRTQYTENKHIATGGVLFN